MKVKQQHLGLILVLVGLMLVWNSSNMMMLDITTATLPQTVTVGSRTWSIYRSTRVGYYYGTVDTYICADVVPGAAGNGFSSLVRHGDEVAALNIIYGLIGYVVPVSPVLGLSPSSATVDVDPSGGGVLFQAAVIGGVAPYTFTWYLNDTLKFYLTTNTPSTNYILEATNVGSSFLKAKCVDGGAFTVWAESVLIVQNPSPSSSLVCSVSPSVATVNVGGSQVFQAVASGGVSPYVFGWVVNDIDTYHAGSSYTVEALNVGTIRVKAKCTDGASTVAWSNEATLTVQAASPPGSSEHVLFISKIGSGTISPAEGVHSYPAGNNVSLSAVAGADSVFVCWTIDGVNVTSSGATVTMTVDHSASALFTFTEGYVPPPPSDNQTLPVDETLPNDNSVPSASPELLGELGLVLIGAVVFFASVKRKRGAG